MKKFYLLAAALLSMSLSAATLDTIQVNDVYYQLNEDDLTATVIRQNSKFVYSKDTIIIPVSVSNDGKTYDVTTIGKAAFRLATCKSIQFAEGSKVTTINMQAFQGANNITELAIPEGVKVIPMTAIQMLKSNGTSKLHKVTLPSTLDSLCVMSLQAASIDTIVCNAVMPPHCALTSGKALNPCLPFTSNNSGDYIPFTAKVIVPEGSESYYRAEQGWTYFNCLDAGATDTLRSSSLYYSITNDSAIVAADITGNKYAYLTAVAIPDTITKTICSIDATTGKTVIAAKAMPVVALGKRAFNGNTTITSLTFDPENKVTEIQSQAMMSMSALCGTLELPEGLKHICTSGIYSGVKGGQLPVKKLILPSTLDSLDVISVILNELDTLEFRGMVAPKCQIRETSTMTQIPWMIGPKNEFPTPKDVAIVIPEGTYENYKNQAGIGDYFTYFAPTAVDNIYDDEINGNNENNANNENNFKTGVYNVLGVYLGTDTTNLPHGIYIINDKKTLR